jgi:cell division protein FtsZ
MKNSLDFHFSHNRNIMNEIFQSTPSEVNLNAPIKVIGVGGGGSNAVNTMYTRGISGVDFIVCNTDAQALEASPVPVKVQLGLTLTGGQGAGSLPEVGRNAAIESLDEVKELIGDKTSMVFITAGMGGGTGTGAAPVIAQAAREMNILTVGIVTIPFQFEGKRRTAQAQDGLEQIRQSVDTLLIIRNDKLRELYGNLTIRAAFNNADEILCTAAKGIAEVITLTGEINVDMNDVNTVMRNSGRAIMGSGTASGEGRARTAVIEGI